MSAISRAEQQRSKEREKRRKKTQRVILFQWDIMCVCASGTKIQNIFGLKKRKENTSISESA